jgi:hypothetical protein
MKIKEGFILREVAGNYIVVAVGEAVKNFNGVINLNESGAFLWKILSQGVENESQLVDALLGEYDVEKEIAERDVNSFIARLKEAGLIK